MRNLTLQPRMDKTGKVVRRWVSDPKDSSIASSMPSPAAPTPSGPSIEEQRMTVGSLLHNARLDEADDITHFIVSASDTTVSRLHDLFITEGDTSLDYMVAWFAKEGESEETALEYIALSDLVDSMNEMDEVAHWLRGLHVPERNKEPLDPTNEASLAQNRALLTFVVAAYEIDYEQKTEFLGFRQGSTHFGKSILDDAIVDLICDHPQRVDELISLVQERGSYDVDLFREMLDDPNPLNNGRL